MIVGPQVNFDDLYSTVYAVIDDAKTRHRVVKLYKGSHGSANPHPVVLDFGTFFAAERRGVLGFACQAVRPSADRFTVDDLSEFDRCHAPRMSTRAAFDLLAASEARPGESSGDYLTYVATRRHRLGAYRGGSSGFDDESRALAAAYFGQLGIPTAPGEVTAALCLTPQSWVDGWNAEYRRRLGYVLDSLSAINRELGHELYRVDEPEGGWYFALRIRRCRLPGPVASGVHASALLLNYAPHRHDSGVGLLPGELFGHDLDGTDEWLTLRGTLAVEPGELHLFVARLRDVAMLLRGPDGASVARHALATAAAVADLDRIVSQRRY